MISLDIKQKFKDENSWMEIDDAIAHIEKWIKSGELTFAENWIKEIEKFVQNDSSINKLKEELVTKKSWWLDLNNNKLKEKANKKIQKKPVEPSIYSQSEKTLAWFSYFWFLAILPLVLNKDSELCQHHGKQWIIFAIFFFIIMTVWNFIPFLWSFMVSLASILQIAIAVYWWIQAFNWKIWIAPIVGDMAKKLKF